jgi:hypothetical protein
MTTIAEATAPKSDQLNADDLLAGRTMTIKITKVTIKPGEQPVAIHFDGDNGKPYKPCKSMCRLMMWIWGNDASKYAGRWLTLYRDDNVEFGGVKVGGIRISHASDIERTVTVNLTKTRARKQPYTVEPLRSAPATDVPPAGADVSPAAAHLPPDAAGDGSDYDRAMEWDHKMIAAKTMSELASIWRTVPAELHTILAAAKDRHKARLTPT